MSDVSEFIFYLTDKRLQKISPKNLVDGIRELLIDVSEEIGSSSKTFLKVKARSFLTKKYFGLRKISSFL